MARRKHNYTPEFREEAVKMVIETSRPIAQVARELSIVEGCGSSEVMQCESFLVRLVALCPVLPCRCVHKRLLLVTAPVV